MTSYVDELEDYRKLRVFGGQTSERYFQLRHYDDGSGIVLSEVDATGKKVVDIIQIDFSNEILVLSEDFFVK